MIKIRGLNLKEDFYDYVLERTEREGIILDGLSLDEFKSLINEFKEDYKYNR